MPQTVKIILECIFVSWIVIARHRRNLQRPRKLEIFQIFLIYRRWPSQIVLGSLQFLVFICHKSLALWGNSGITDCPRIFPSMWKPGLKLHLGHVYFAVGMEAFKFLNTPSQVLSGFLGMNIDINCSTNDPYATVQLFHSKDFAKYTERTLSPEKLHLNKQVFTLLNLDVKDAGQYNCKATDGHQTIEWPSSHGLLFLSRRRWNTNTCTTYLMLCIILQF